MNLPRISLSRPSFSSRFFIYFLFGLIILILAAEGGYYWWRVKQKVISLRTVGSRMNEIEDNLNPTYKGGVLSYATKNGEHKLLIVGVVKKIEDSVLLIESENEQIRVKLSPDIRVTVKEVEERIPIFATGINELFKYLVIGDHVALGGITLQENEEFPVASECRIVRI